MLAWLYERRLARKAQTGMQRSHKKAHSNRDAERGWQHVFLQNHHKKMKMPHTIYDDFESLVRKVQGCKPNPEKGSVTVKTEQHEACGFACTIVRTDGKACGPMVYRGENAVYLFLQHLLQEGKLIREHFSIKKPLVMTPEEAQRIITHRWV